MKQFAVVLGVLLAGFSRASATSIELDAGTLRNARGMATVPVGGLLQLIVSTGSGTFPAPTATSFVSGDNVVLASVAMNNNFGTGETDSFFNYNLTTVNGMASPTTIDQGDALLLRWWPTLTASATSPGGGGVTFGQYRSNSSEMLSDGTSSGIAWFAPAQTAQLSGSSGLNFLTSDISGPPFGTNSPSTGFANFSTVPEPSMWAFMAGTLLSAVFVVRAQRAKD